MLRGATVPRKPFAALRDAFSYRHHEMNLFLLGCPVSSSWQSITLPKGPRERGQCRLVGHLSHLWSPSHLGIRILHSVEHWIPSHLPHGLRG
ncbi:hypothetical protein CGRA01v4_03772 [Colletotrichum graminicola]|nr:hypothetical protein CGRA01v4_03772 [Colletotrichum graminicola]